MEDWPEWRKKIINLAAKESLTRPLLKKILKELEESGEYQYPNGEMFSVFIYDVY